MSAVSPPMMHRLIEAFEASVDTRISLDGQVLMGFPRWRVPRLLGNDHDAIRERYIDVVGYAGSYMTYFGDERVDVDLEEDDSSDTVMYLCPETMGWQRLPIEDVQVWQIKERQFLHEVADLLNIPQAQRRGIEQPLIDHALWKLGSAKLSEGFHIPVLVARSLGLHLDQILSVLATQPPSLVLCTSRQLLEYWPPGVRVCRLADAIIPHLEKPTLDVKWLYQQAIGDLNGSNVPDNFPVQYDDATQVLSIRGKPDWRLKGAKQPKAIQHMIQQALIGRWKLSSKEILDATKSNGQVGGSRTMSSLFKNTPWEDYIVNVTRGMYSFNLGD